ncbi:MAG: hypothetical protein CL878_00550 [Dehalococcoidia bacterium]|nr:hypothetical protein [Dehalococcoidia bacterium]
MMGPRCLLFSTFAAGLVVALAFGAGYFVGSQEAAQARSALQTVATPTGSRSAQALQPADVADRFGILWEAWDLIQREYIGRPVDSTRLTYGAIRGMMEALDDPYSIFLDPRTQRLQKASLNGAYEGIGTTIEMKNGQHTVVAPFEGSPAAGAGLRAGDIVLRVDGQGIIGLSMPEAVSLVRGPADTSVQLTILRPGDPAETLDLTIVRKRITTQSVTSEVTDGDVAVIRIRSFSSSTPRQFDAALRRAQSQQTRGIVLDLRDNPGGFLSSAVAVASQFLPTDSVVVIEQLGNGNQQPHRVLRSGRSLDIPVVVLVNKGTASGAEIVAGALADHDRAILVGESTFGKGTVQIPHELSDGSAIRITTARWLTPSRHIIQGVGLTPDVVVTATAEGRTAGEDQALARAQQLLRSPAPASAPAA